MKINREQVKLMLLSAQGMNSPLAKPAEKQDVIDTIRKMGLLQIDTISVVNRSPYFVLWSRLGNYETNWLEEIHREGLLFEYYAHAACFIPIEQYPVFRPDMGSIDFSWRHSEKYFQEHQDLIQRILTKIKENGPIRSADFSSNGKKGNGWWDWKEEKIALENLWSHGDLMVAYRIGFQRYYDLTQNVYPKFAEKQFSNQEAINEKVLYSIKSMGATRAKWVPDFYRLKKQEAATAIANLTAEKKIISVPSAEWNEDILIHSENEPLLEEAFNQPLTFNRTSFLSPFDPIIWDRQRTRELFDFDYTIECYLPPAKRVFGYFTLPILHNGQIIGRMDAKAHRLKRLFEVKSIHFEPEFQLNDDFANDFMATLRSCANWHNTGEIIFSDQVPNELVLTFQRKL